MSMSLDKLQKIRVNMVVSYISLMFEMEANKSSTTGVLKQKPNFLNCSTGLSTDS